MEVLFAMRMKIRARPSRSPPRKTRRIRLESVLILNKSPKKKRLVLEVGKSTDVSQHLPHFPAKLKTRPKRFKHAPREKAAQAQPQRPCERSPELPEFVLSRDSCYTSRPGFLERSGPHYWYYFSSKELPKSLPAKLLAQEVKKKEDAAQVQRLYRRDKWKWYSAGGLSTFVYDPSDLETDLDYRAVYCNFLKGLARQSSVMFYHQESQRRFMGNNRYNVTDYFRKSKLCKEQMYPPVEQSLKQSLDKSRKHLERLLLRNDRGVAVGMLHIAFTAAGARVFESQHGDWTSAMHILERVKQQTPQISYGDLYQLGGVIAVELLEGPDVPFHPGREEKYEPSLDHSVSKPMPFRVTAEAKVHHVFSMDALDMGLSQRDVVALCGCRCLEVQPLVAQDQFKSRESTYKAISQELAGFTKRKRDIESAQASLLPKLSNRYFRDLVSSNCVPAPLSDPEYKGYVEIFAKDEDAFFKAYRVAHAKLSNLA